MASPATLRRCLISIGIFSIFAILVAGISLFGSPAGLRTIPSLIRRSPTVKLRQGTYVGNELNEDWPQVLDQFLGIPYGQSTARDQRFRAPLPVTASDEKFEATEYGHRCPQTPDDETSEDCLNVNVWRPRRWLNGKRLPVLVHVFGGSFNFGFAQTRGIPNMVAYSAEPFIGVSFNYRVGALGFLPSNQTAKEGLLNVGLKDQALLLQWVQEDIAAFAGNPDDVTLMGSSAGAHSVCDTSLFSHQVYGIQ